MASLPSTEAASSGGGCGWPCGCPPASAGTPFCRPSARGRDEITPVFGPSCFPRVRRDDPGPIIGPSVLGE
jgi:hypothetical protein